MCCISEWLKMAKMAFYISSNLKVILTPSLVHLKKCILSSVTQTCAEFLNGPFHRRISLHFFLIKCSKVYLFNLLKTVGSWGLLIIKLWPSKGTLQFGLITICVCDDNMPLRSRNTPVNSKLWHSGFTLVLSLSPRCQTFMNVTVSRTHKTFNSMCS